MIHPHTELKFISDEIGLGVVATKLIPAGTVTWVLDNLDREFKHDEVLKMNKQYQDILDTYCYRNNKGNYILCWDNGRFVNHSFKSNCISTAYDFEIAVRDIAPGEQLTDDYGYLNVNKPFKGIDEGTERKVVYPDDLPNYHQLWDQQLAANFDKILKLSQPLQSFIKEKTWNTIKLISEGKKELNSIMEIYYNEKVDAE